MTGTRDGQSEARAKDVAGADRIGGLPTLALEALRDAGRLERAGDEALPLALAGVRELAQSDGSIAEILAGHIAASVAARLVGLGAASTGGLWAIADGGGLSGRPDGGGWRLEGNTHAEAGALVADRWLLTFRDDARAPCLAAVAAVPAALRAVPDTIGQRQAAGAALHLAGVPVEAGSWAPLPETTLGRIALVRQAARIALLLGTGEGALAEGRAYTLEKSRPWVHSGYARHIDDPFVRRRYGELHIRARAAAALADGAFAGLDAILSTGEAPSQELQAALDAAEVYAGQFALAAGSGIFEVMGARSATRENGYDRFWRNVRTLTLRHPAEPREVAIADWLLAASPPAPVLSPETLP